MEVILLEHITRLGGLGDVVKVKDGFGRNYLLPQGKAIRATKDNLAQFEARKAQLAQENQAKKSAAEAVSGKVNGIFVEIIQQAGDDDRLFGSVRVQDIAALVKENTGVAVDKSFVQLNAPIKQIGIYPVRVALHPEVVVSVNVNVARSLDEAQEAKRLFQTGAEKKSKKSAQKQDAAPEQEIEEDTAGFFDEEPVEEAQ